MTRKVPPYCAALRQRLKYGNLPQWVYVHAGVDAWKRAKHPNATRGDCVSTVWDGGEYAWPVAGCLVHVEIAAGPSRMQVLDLAAQMLAEHAAGVILWWLDADDGLPLLCFSDGSTTEMELDDLREVFNERSAID